MDDDEIYRNILRAVEEHQSDPKGITKTELARIYSQRWGNSQSVIWDYIRDLIDENKIVLKTRTRKQQTLFIAN